MPREDQGTFRGVSRERSRSLENPKFSKKSSMSHSRKEHTRERGTFYREESSPSASRHSRYRSRSPYRRNTRRRSSSPFFCIDAVGEVDSGPEDRHQNQGKYKQVEAYSSRIIANFSDDKDDYVSSDERNYLHKEEAAGRSRNYRDSPENPYQDAQSNYQDHQDIYSSRENSPHRRHSKQHFGDQYSSSEQKLVQQKSSTHSTVEVESFSGDSFQSVQEWLQNIEDRAETNKWDDKMKIFQMTTKLTGYARSWYIGLDDTNLHWMAWKEKLIRSFPCDQDYQQQLLQMLHRYKRDTESFDKYFCHKTAMLNACDISGRRAVSCIIGGLKDREIAKDARKKNFENPEKLYEFLRTVEMDKPPEDSKKNKYKIDNRFMGECHKCNQPGHIAVQCTAETPAFNSRPPFLYRKPDSKTKNRVCYHCKKTGHFAAQCTALTETVSTTKRCYNCHKYGHLAQNCIAPVNPALGGSFGRNFISTQQQGTENPKGVKESVICFGCGQSGHYVNRCPVRDSFEFGGHCNPLIASKISIMHGGLHPPCFTKFFVDAYVDGVCLSGYVDLVSKHVTIKQEDAMRLNMAVVNCCITIQGFGNSLVTTVGVTEFVLRVDQVSNKVIGYVIPDNVQAIAVIVGSSFVNMPNIVTDSKGDSIKIFHKTDDNQRGQGGEENSRFLGN